MSATQCEVCGVVLTVWNRELGEDRCSKCQKTHGKKVDERKESMSYFDLHPELTEDMLREPFEQSMGPLVLGVIIVDLAIFIGMAVCEAFAGKSGGDAPIRVGVMAGFFAGLFVASLLLFSEATPLLLRRWQSMIAADAVGFLVGFGGFYSMAVSGGPGFLAGQGAFFISLASFTVSSIAGILVALGWTGATDATRVDDLVAQFHDWQKQRRPTGDPVADTASASSLIPTRAQEQSRPPSIQQQSPQAEQFERAISFACGCGKGLRAKEGLAGRRVRCPTCGQVLVVPLNVGR